MRYLLTSETPEDRTHESYLNDVDQQNKHVETHCQNKANLKSSVRGVKGKSVLSSLRDFDCVWGFSYEYMHSVLLGVTKQLWNTWNDKFLKSPQRALIDSRLISIKPPTEIHHVPRVLKDKCKWKAAEWRSWLLFYSIPCLSGILDDELLESYKLFVRSIHKLLSLKITDEDLVQCEIDLLLFVDGCQNFYGTLFMTFNVHSLLHIVSSVRKNGPL